MKYVARITIEQADRAAQNRGFYATVLRGSRVICRGDVITFCVTTPSGDLIDHEMNFRNVYVESINKINNNVFEKGSDIIFLNHKNEIGG